MDGSLLSRIGVPAAVVAAALVVGVVLDRLAVARIRAAAKRSGWRGGEVAARSLAGMLPLWAAIAALWWAAPRLGLSINAEMWAGRVLTVLLVGSLTWTATRVAGGLVRVYVSRADTPLPSASIFVNITRLAVIAVGLLAGLNILGIQIAPLLAALGISGLAVALAFQQTLTNLFAGLQITASGQVRPGDVLALASGEEGVVEDITWRTTTLRQDSGALVIVPNSVLASVVAMNRGPAGDEHPVTVTVPVPYVFGLEKVSAIALEVAAEVQGGVAGAVREHRPTVVFTAFADNGVTLEVGLRAKRWTDRGALTSEFMTRLHRRLKDEGMALTLPEG